MKTTTAPIALCLLALTLTGLGASASTAASVHQTSVSYTVGEKVTRVVVDDEIGRVLIKTGAKHSVRATKHWDRTEPSVTITEGNGVVTVKAKCPSSSLVDGVVIGDNNCSVDIVVTVPASTDVKAVTDVGAIVTRNMAGSAQLTTSIGDINAVRSTGSPLVSRSDVGDINVSVPAGGYDYRTHTDEGDVSVRGLTYRANSKSVIRATTSTGDIALKGF